MEPICIVCFQNITKGPCGIGPWTRCQTHTAKELRNTANSIEGMGSIGPTLLLELRRAANDLEGKQTRMSQKRRNNLAGEARLHTWEEELYARYPSYPIHKN